MYLLYDQLIQLNLFDSLLRELYLLINSGNFSEQCEVTLCLLDMIIPLLSMQ